MAWRDPEPRRGQCAKQTIVTSHASGVRTRVSVELASVDTVCVHRELIGGSPLRRLVTRQLDACGGLSARGTPVLGRRSDAIAEGRQSAQCTPVARRRELLASPAASPAPVRRTNPPEEETEACSLDNTIISGWLKFRDNKRWKARWGVVTKLSPAADCLHLQLYRDSRARCARGPAKASLALQHFLGFESGFTLDKESNTVALLCRDVSVVLAFDSRERLIQWQVKLAGQLGEPSHFLVLLAGEGGGARLPPGPARLHLLGRRFALAAGTPPRLLGLWELAHLRRYGVVEGRFCFEGGSLCGAGEGLHVLLSDRPHDIAAAFDMAAREQLSAPDRRTASSRGSIGTERGNNNLRPDTRLSDFNSFDQAMADSASAIYEDNTFGTDSGVISPFWPFDDRRGFAESGLAEGRHRARGSEAGGAPWSDADHVTLERCVGCRTRLGAESRSATVALTPSTTQFNPAWTMECASHTLATANDSEYLTPKSVHKNMEAACRCKDVPPKRPPKPGHLELCGARKAPALLPPEAFARLKENASCVTNAKIGPYDNYDFPKMTNVEAENGEYYDTPRRIKDSLADDLFRVTDVKTGSLILAKNCGCLLKFGAKKKPVIVEYEENLQSAECPCQKVTNWANNLINIPYCRRNSISDKNSPHMTNVKYGQAPLYATVDISRKSNRQSNITLTDKENGDTKETTFMNYENVDICHEKPVKSPFANYENLDFALSLEYYENAKDLLKKAGVTQSELDALTANVNSDTATLHKKPRSCLKCSHSQNVKGAVACSAKKNKSDEYLLMEPTHSIDSAMDCDTQVCPPPGYTPMSPAPTWSQSLKHSSQKANRANVEKSLSNPALNVSKEFKIVNDDERSVIDKNIRDVGRRSSSMDGENLLEDLKELDSSIGSRSTSLSLETLRNIAVDTKKPSSSCAHSTTEYHELGDCLVSEPKCTSTHVQNCNGSKDKPRPHLRNKYIDNAQIKRSSSVPCKSAGNRDSSSSNDSGVSSCSLKHGGHEFAEFELPLTIAPSRHHWTYKRMRGHISGCLHASLPRKSKSSDPLRDLSMQLQRTNVPAKSSSAEAEVPVLPPKQIKGVVDTHSTSSGTSDMSDYIETLSLSSSHSSSDTPVAVRMSRQATSTLRPRSGKEYHNRDPILSCVYQGKQRPHYTQLP